MLIRLHHAAILLSEAILAVCRLALVVMVAVISALVVSRYVFSYSFPWAEEVTRFLLVWSMLLAAALLQRRDDHIRVAFIVDKLSAPLRALVAIVLRLLVLGLLILLVRYGVRAALGMEMTRAPGLGIPMTWPYLSIPVAAALMVGFTLLSLVDDVRLLIGLEPLRPDAKDDRLDDDL